MKVALIDDNEMDRFLIERLLKEYFKDIELYKSITEAQGKITADMVFCDLDLGETWGVDTIKRARELWPSKHIIAITSLAGKYLFGSVTLPILEVGANEVISKNNLDETIIEYVTMGVR